MSTSTRARIAAIVAAVGILAGAGACSANAPTSVAGPAAGPLSQLLGDNGLYISGESYSTYLSTVSVTDTVYDDLVVKDSGTDALPLWHTTAGAAALNDFTATNPIWGRWFASAAHTAAGQSTPLQDAAALRPLLHKDGFYADSTQKASDLTADLASTWAALQVNSHTGTPQPQAALPAVQRWLDGQLAHIRFPVQACQLAQSYQALGQPEPAQLAAYASHQLTGNGGLPTRISDMTALANLYGATCAAAPAHQIPAVIAQSIIRTLTPYLTGGSTALQRYYLAETWLAVGGPRASLASLATTAEADLNGTGNAHGHTVMIGALVPTYYAVQTEKASGYLDRARIPYITQALSHTSPTGDPLSYLAGAATLCTLNHCAKNTDADVTHAVNRLPTTIDATTIDGYIGAQQFLQALGRNYPHVTLHKIDPTTAAGLHAQVMATATFPNAKDGFTQALPTATLLDGLLRRTSPWNDPTTIDAAVSVLAARHALTPQAAQAARSTLLHLQGCAGIATLSAAGPGSTAGCDLSTSLATLQALPLLPRA